MTGNMIEQDLLIEQRKRLDRIAAREYERNTLLSSRNEQSGDDLGAVVRGRIEQFVAALRTLRPLRNQPATR